MKHLIISATLAAVWFWASSLTYGIPLHVFIGGATVTPPSSGPIEFVAAEGNNFNTTRSPLAAYPTVQAGDIMLAIFAASGVASYNGTPPGTGWTEIDELESAAASETTAVFWKRAGSSEPSTETWTDITAANEAGRVIVLAYRNCIATGDPINGHVESSGGLATTADTDAVVPSVDDCMIIGIFACDPGANPRGFTWDAPINERIDGGTTPTGQNGFEAAIFVGDYLQPTAGSITMGGDFDATETRCEFILALTPQ